MCEGENRSLEAEQKLRSIRWLSLSQTLLRLFSSKEVTMRAMKWTVVNLCKAALPQAQGSSVKPSRPKQSGFTIVELLIAMALIVFIMTILDQAFSAGVRAFRELVAVGDMEE